MRKIVCYMDLCHGFKSSAIRQIGQQICSNLYSRTYMAVFLKVQYPISCIILILKIRQINLMNIGKYGTFEFLQNSIKRNFNCINCNYIYQTVSTEIIAIEFE